MANKDVHKGYVLNSTVPSERGRNLNALKNNQAPKHPMKLLIIIRFKSGVFNVYTFVSYITITV